MCGVLLVAAVVAAVLSGWQVNISVVRGGDGRPAGAETRPGIPFVTAPDEGQNVPEQAEEFLVELPEA